MSRERIDTASHRVIQARCLSGSPFDTASTGIIVLTVSGQPAAVNSSCGHDLMTVRGFDVMSACIRRFHAVWEPGWAGLPRA